MIAHHSSYARIYKRHWIACMILFCWAFAFGMLLPTYLKIWGMFEWDPDWALYYLIALSFALTVLYFALQEPLALKRPWVLAQSSKIRAVEAARRLFSL